MKPKWNRTLTAALIAVSQDVSLPVFQDLLTQGYDNTTWQTSPSATDGQCIAKNGDQDSLENFIATTQYDAPIYSKTHPVCNCNVLVQGPGLPDVIVNAFGVQG